jgi:predicted AAA+ superfamily ATPase
LWFEAYFETLLTRDVVLVEPSLASLSLRQGLAFLRELALAQGNEINLSDVAAKSSVSSLMSKRLMKALETLALVDMIPPATHAKKSVRKFQVEWKDSGLWGYLTGQEKNRCLDDIKATHLLLTHELRSQSSDFDNAVFWNFYRNRDGASIPWIFKKGNQCVAIKFHPSENPGSYDWRVLKKFVQENKESLAVLVGPEKSTPTILDKKIWFMPFTLLF